MKIRFLADENLDKGIVDGLCRREPAIDFLSAQHAGIRGVSDLEILRIAAEQQRVLVTHDKNTMPAAFGEFLVTHQCSGLIIIPDYMGIGTAVENLLIVWSVDEQEEWLNRIVHLKL